MSRIGLAIAVGITLTALLTIGPKHCDTRSFSIGGAEIGGCAH